VRSAFAVLSATAFAILLTGRYPRAAFDFVLGVNRTLLRVAACPRPMTGEYPPFRPDPGRSGPVSPLSVVTAPAPAG
jgi:hypothetical protein